MATPRTPVGTLWPLDRIEYVQWLWYCGLSPHQIQRTIHCSRGVLMRHLRVDLRHLRALRAREAGRDSRLDREAGGEAWVRDGN